MKACTSVSFFFFFFMLVEHSKFHNEVVLVIWERRLVHLPSLMIPKSQDHLQSHCLKAPSVWAHPSQKYQNSATRNDRSLWFFPSILHTLKKRTDISPTNRNSLQRDLTKLAEFCLSFLSCPRKSKLVNQTIPFLLPGMGSGRALLRVLS